MLKDFSIDKLTPKTQKKTRAHFLRSAEGSRPISKGKKHEHGCRPMFDSTANLSMLTPLNASTNGFSTNKDNKMSTYKLA